MTVVSAGLLFMLGLFIGIGMVALSQRHQAERMKALQKVADAAECCLIRRYHGDMEDCWEYLTSSVRDLRKTKNNRVCEGELI